MKFMQKTKEKTEKSEELDSSGLPSTLEHVNKNLKFIHEPSYVLIEGLKFGRISYRGMNAEIERLNEDSNPRQENKQKQSRNDQEKEISDQEMAKRYANLMGKTRGQGRKIFHKK